MIPFEFREPINLLSCTSTNDIIRDLSSLEEGIIVTSMIQTAGRGKIGNIWFSEPGGLYFSFLLKPLFDPPQNETLSQLTGKVLKDVLASYLKPNTIQFKEPNDILVNGKKIAGILIEARVVEEKNLYIIVGIGVNISNKVPSYATSLKNEGLAEINEKEFLKRFLLAFDEAYNEWQIRKY